MKVGDVEIGNKEETLRSINLFYDAMKAVEEPIAPGISSMTRLSFLSKLFQMKIMNRAMTKLMSKVFDVIWELLNTPGGFPKSWYEAKKQI